MLVVAVILSMGEISTSGGTCIAIGGVGALGVMVWILNVRD